MQAPTNPLPPKGIANESMRISYKLGLIASLVVRLVGLLLVFASQKVVHNVQNEMAEFVVPLREEIKDCL